MLRGATVEHNVGRAWMMQLGRRRRLPKMMMMDRGAAYIPYAHCNAFAVLCCVAGSRLRATKQMSGSLLAVSHLPILTPPTWTPHYDEMESETLWP